MAADIDRAGVAKAYGRWAPVYDLVFGKVFDHGRQSTIAEADRIGGRILDVGVGTGLSLSDYSRTTKLCGVDISEPMLRKAQQRVHDAHQHIVDLTPEIPGDKADRDRETQGEADHLQADPHRDPRTVDEAAQDVAAQVVGAEQVTRRRAAARVKEVLGDRAVRCDDRCGKRDHADE